MPRSSEQLSRILLISANKMTNPYPVFPIGLAFIDAALSKAGFSVRIWDQLIHSEQKLIEDLSWAQAAGISLRNVDNVSSTSPEGYVSHFIELLSTIRQNSNIPIIAGGSAFSIFPEEMLERLGLDWGIQGEAEEAVLMWLNALTGTSSMDAVPGLVFRRADGQLKVNPQSIIKPADIPSPRPDESWIRAYLERGGMLNVQSQRGCPFHCTYCTYPWIEGKSYRHRQPAQIVDEIRHLQSAGTRYVFFTDSVFNTSPRHVEAICKGLISASLGIEWGCFARPHKLNGNLIDLMIESGMKHIEFGSDSFSDATLASYGKSFRFTDILEASELVASRKVHACHYIIFGGPGETAQTIQETVDNSKLLPECPIFAFSGMRIYPHTPLHSASCPSRSANDLMDPFYYTQEALPEATLQKLIKEAVASLPNWILSDHADSNFDLTAQLRAKGKQGPLWEYLALSKRLSQPN